MRHLRKKRPVVVELIFRATVEAIYKLDRGLRIAPCSSTNQLLTSHREKGYIRVELVRRRTAFNVYVMITGAMMIFNISPD